MDVCMDGWKIRKQNQLHEAKMKDAAIIAFYVKISKLAIYWAYLVVDTFEFSVSSDLN